METTKLHVDGMSCSHCAASVKRAVEALAGVRSVSVSLESGEVTVDFDGTAASVDQIADAIMEEGYEVV